MSRKSRNRSGRLQTAIDFSVYVLVRSWLCLVQSLRVETCQSLSRFSATLLTHVLRIRRSVVDDNLRHAFPELSPAERTQIIWKMWYHLSLLIIEVANLSRKVHDTNWRDHIQLHGVKPVLRALLDERPFVIVSGHFGNFEMGGYILGTLGFPTYTVARTLDNPFLNEAVNRLRGGSGQHMIPKDGGYEQILEVLAANGTLTLLADQHAGRKGCWVDFFGRPASTHKAIALFSMQHDAPLAVSYTRRTGRAMHVELRLQAMVDPRDDRPETANVKTLTQWYTKHLEQAIRETPDQYWWIHRRWKPREKTQAKRAAA